MAITWRDIIIISDAADLDDAEEEDAEETEDREGGDASGTRPAILLNGMLRSPTRGQI